MVKLTRIPPTMHVDAVVAFVCIRRLATSRSVFPIRISFVGHLFLISEIMCSILSRQKPQTNDWSDSCWTRLFTDSPEGNGNEQSRVTRLLIQRPPFSFIENCSETPRGTAPVLYMFCRDSIVMGNAYPWSISLLMDLSRADEFSSERDDLCFPLSIIAYQFNFVFPI